ncbi:MAG: hypothetical protein CM15mP106_5890 [Candidatus Neomarinimicrobiota bacterium]|nr:MAG: hypothetical protein CM15mP106_5890 [Candidatus Neomarinimicrobiota bacterium]
MTMPGLPRVPALNSIKLNKKGEIKFILIDRANFLAPKYAFFLIYFQQKFLFNKVICFQHLMRFLKTFLFYSN